MQKFHWMLLGLVMVGVAHADLYRSIDKDGKVHYSDRPVQGAPDVEELKPVKPAASNEDMSYETRRAMQNFPVTLYVGDACGSACTQAKGYLNKRGIPFTEKNLSTKEEIDAYKAASGGDQVPAMTVGRSWVKGFLESEWKSELDIAGYPQSAGYRAPKPATAPVQPAQ